MYSAQGWELLYIWGSNMAVDRRASQE